MMLYFVVYAIIFAVNWPTKNAARVQQLCNENLTSLWRYVFIYLLLGKMGIHLWAILQTAFSYSTLEPIVYYKW